MPAALLSAVWQIVPPPTITELRAPEYAAGLPGVLGTTFHTAYVRFLEVADRPNMGNPA